MENRIEKALQAEKARNNFYAEEAARMMNAMEIKEEFANTHEMMFDHADAKDIEAELANGTILGWSTGFALYTVGAVECEAYEDRNGNTKSYRVALYWNDEMIEEAESVRRLYKERLENKVLYRI